MPSEQPNVVVVGGGIAGLSAAHGFLRSAESAGREARLTLLEAEGRLGGKIRTEQFAGRTLDVGAEALLARVPGAVELCRELGIEQDLVAPSSDQAYIWTDRLRALPPRLMAGLPDGYRPLLESGILSRAGLLRAGLDLLLPSRAPVADVSIGSVVRRRMGGEALERLIDPLLGGIHAGSCDELSLASTAPQLMGALRSGHGLARGLRAVGARAPSGPMFLTARGGLGQIVDRLEGELDGARLRTATALSRLEPLADGRVRLTLLDGSSLVAEEVILAIPAHAAAEVLCACAPAAARELAGIRYASVATVALAFADGHTPRLPAGSGFLTQRGLGRTITACTFTSQKWPHLGGESTVLKCSVGHSGDESALALGDEELVAAVLRDLDEALGHSPAPEQAEVFRFPDALPQYTVGHAARIARIESELKGLPVRLCGAAYHGVGVPACIRDGLAAGAAAAGALVERPPGGGPTIDTSRLELSQTRGA